MDFSLEDFDLDGVIPCEVKQGGDSCGAPAVAIVRGTCPECKRSKPRSHAICRAHWDASRSITTTCVACNYEDWLNRFLVLIEWL